MWQQMEEEKGHLWMQVAFWQCPRPQCNGASRSRTAAGLASWERERGQSLYEPRLQCGPFTHSMLTAVIPYCGSELSPSSLTRRGHEVLQEPGRCPHPRLGRVREEHLLPDEECKIGGRGDAVRREQYIFWVFCNLFEFDHLLGLDQGSLF